jgi:hypothetical protein
MRSPYNQLYKLLALQKSFGVVNAPTRFIAHPTILAGALVAASVVYGAARIVTSMPVRMRIGNLGADSSQILPQSNEMTIRKVDDKLEAIRRDGIDTGKVVAEIRVSPESIQE